MTASKRERLKEAVVKSLAMGASVLAACAGVQIGRSTFYRWLEGDATFEEAVMMARVGLIEEVMGELRLLAFGRYVEEEKIVETASGPRKEWRKRWRDGKVSALMAILKMTEKDLAGMEERRRKMTNDPMTNDQGGRGDLGLSVGVSRVSRFEGEMGSEGVEKEGASRSGETGRVAAGAGASHIEEQGEEVCGSGLAGRVAGGAGASHIEERGEVVRLGVSQVSRNTLKNGGGEVVRESRRERRERERIEKREAKKAAKRATREGFAASRQR